MKVEAGLNEDGLSGNGYAKWYAPVRACCSGSHARDADSGNPGELRVNNTLVRGTTVPFAPREGNKVLWYTCGPTVYDVAHMGHARAYLTFDILRRILEDYFNYEVVYQMNITDIDDKIIVRARRNELLRRFKERASSAKVSAADVGERVVDAAGKALAREKEKLEGLKLELEKVPGSSKEGALLDTAIKEQELKLSQAEDAMARAKAAVTELSGDPSSPEKLQAVLESAKDSLAESLDAEEGHTIAGEKGEDHTIFREHATKFEGLFHEDMENLGVRPPTILTRVSEYVPQVVAYIEGIQNKGFAYESNGSVYFDTRAFVNAGHEYRKLEPMPASQWEDIKGGKVAAEEAGEKKSQMDFALWKKSKQGEPAWSSPWGPGRPGWHIECSAMAGDVLGDNLDIHAGGEDLCFPHHDNELAQSEAFCGCKQWVNYFFHAGHLHIRGLKMSKSLKNFVTIGQALEEHTANQIRLLFLLQNWDRPMLYSDQMVDDAKAKEQMLKNFFGTVKGLLRETPPNKYGGVPQNWHEDEQKLSEELSVCKSAVHSSLCDNFDTPRAMEAIFSLVSSTNKYINRGKGDGVRVMLLLNIARYVSLICRTFGLAEDSDSIGFGGSTGNSSGGASEGLLNAFVSFRDQVRKLARDTGNRDLLELCDSVRDDVMPGLGVRLEDRADGSLYKLDDPAVLLAEIATKKKKQEEAAAAKKQKKIMRMQKDLLKWESVSEDLFQSDERFSKIDEESGMPVAMADGKPLSKSLQKACQKALTKRKKERDELDRLGGEDYIKGLREELEKLSM